MRNNDARWRDVAHLRTLGGGLVLNDSPSLERLCFKRGGNQEVGDGVARRWEATRGWG